MGPLYYDCPFDLPSMIPGESHNKWYQYYCSNIYIFKVEWQFRGVARDFVILKPTKTNGEFKGIWLSYFTFQIVNNKGADQTTRLRRLVCALLFTSIKVRVSRVDVHMMFKPKLHGLRLATPLGRMPLVLKLNNSRNNLYLKWGQLMGGPISNIRTFINQILRPWHLSPEIKIFIIIYKPYEPLTYTS